MMVSMKVPIMPIRPDCAGVPRLAGRLGDAGGAEPGLVREDAARHAVAHGSIIVEPAKPPAAAVPVKASEKISPKAAGICPA